MSSAAVLRRLQTRASQAELLLAELRTRVHALRQSAVAKLCSEESARLLNENEALRGDIKQLKEKLKQAEIKNGISQVEMPSPGQQTQVNGSPATKTTPVVQVTTASETTPKADTPMAPAANQTKKAQKKENKPKKLPAPTTAEAPVDVSRLDMRIGVITAVKKHPDADGLYIEDVDVGEAETRTVISGLVKYITLEEMLNRRAVFLCNLKPAKMRGVMSHGMIMCASIPDKVEIISVPKGCNIGDRVTVAEYPGVSDALLNPKKKIFEQVAPDLRINADGVATYKGAPWRVEGIDVPFRAASLADVPIK